MFISLKIIAVVGLLFLQGTTASSRVVTKATRAEVCRCIIDCISSFRMARLFTLTAGFNPDNHFLQQLFEVGFRSPIQVRHPDRAFPIQRPARFVKSLLLDWRPESNFSSAYLTIGHLLTFLFHI
ncbi:hypothetical protein MJO28_003005 [Puccinia striiformis f. sp. tritici]|uniref:Secreted protein n=3 Tax=Puccinia striiformis TaxID=27350 RepID=A0A0L0VAL4_9BASI|nr:hypothetical protein MJO28_003005 [Puccinia striiformis f. sp. tritici]KAI9624327.1 hypothetical protein H4Q26_016897 [Puccinia striiformis f. sp. tritici PST-130]KNE96323.1 hypothetical protein PSTG_10442 [Puccinia striiformis f. sp. tritici PST-78]POW09870.1 hypothetical protein PSTT_06474 [Puccinia striiformis]